MFSNACWYKAKGYFITERRTSIQNTDSYPTLRVDFNVIKARFGTDVCSGTWACPNGSNGQVTITLDNYRSRLLQRMSNEENLSSGFKDLHSVYSWPVVRFDRFLANEQTHMGKMGKWLIWRCITKFHRMSSDNCIPHGMEPAAVRAVCPAAWIATRQCPSSPTGCTSQS